MKTSKNVLSLLLFLLQKTLSLHYRLIIIENGYNWKESSRTRVAYDQDTFTKIYSAILLKTSNYSLPSITKKTNFGDVSKVTDNNKWEILTINDKFVNHGMSTWGDTIGLELPIKKIDVKIDLNLGSQERAFRINKRVICDRNNKDEKSLFFFAHYFAKKYIYGNSGFDLFMKNSEFSFSKNVLLMEDFESDFDPDNFRVSFNVESDYLSFFNVNLKFKIKIIKLKFTRFAKKNPELENFKYNTVYYDDKEFLENKNNFLIIKTNREDNSFDNFYLYFKRDEEPKKPILSAGFGLVHNEYGGSNVVTRFYCEVIVDGLKRFFITNIFQKAGHSNYGEFFANSCYNSMRNSDLFGQFGIWKRKYSAMDLEFDFWNNTKSTILGSFSSFQSTTVRLSIILTSARDIPENKAELILV